MLAIVDLLQLHPVVVDHTVWGDHALISLNQKEGRFHTIYILQFFQAGTAAVEVHIVAAAHGFQIREVRDDGDLLTAEG